MLPALSKVFERLLYSQMTGFADTGALIMDLSKAFDCIGHELLIAKLNAYWFSKKAQVMIYNYISGRKQRVKLNGHSATGMKPVLVYHRVLFLDVLFSMYILMIFSLW